MRYAVVSADVVAADEPATLAEVKAQCRVEAAFTADDGLLTALIPAARQLAEKHTGRLLAPRAATVTLDRFPAGGPVRLPVEPVAAVTAVRYRAADGTPTTLAGAAYRAALGFSPPEVAPASGTAWPDTEADAPAAVEIDVTCGSAAPVIAKQAVLLTVAYWYGSRGDGGDPERTGLPPAAVRLLNLAETGGYS